MALSAAEKQVAYRERQKGKEAARKLGRRYGEHEAHRIAASGRVPPAMQDRGGRIQRAERYSVWLFEESPKA